jgi:hypothetical protein
MSVVNAVVPQYEKIGDRTRSAQAGYQIAGLLCTIGRSGRGRVLASLTLTLSVSLQ